MDKISKFFEQHGIFGLDEFISSIFFREYIDELQEALFNLLALPVVFDLHMLNPTMDRGILRESPSSIIISVYDDELVDEIPKSIS